MKSLMTAMFLALGLANAPAMAAGNPCNPCSMKSHANPCNPCSIKKHMNPCNPCSMKKHANPCNPCSMKPKMNPCNPCSMKKHMNPCNPCSMRKGANPCSMKQSKGQWGTPGNTPIREHAFDNFGQAVSLGKKLWHDKSLGTAGVSCASCHANYEFLHFDRNQNFPHFVKMVGDVVTLDQMINYCMLNPMKGKALDPNSKEMTALAAYYRAYRMQYLREHRR